MIEFALQRLNFILEKVPGLLTQMSEEKMSEKSAPNKWSKKEVVGHLIDSATNNHQRIVRGQFEPIPEIRYNENKWNQFNFYQKISSSQIILFWTIYNKQLSEIIKRIPKDNLKRKVKVGDDSVTIECLIVDYVDHLEHHLTQVINY